MPDWHVSAKGLKVFAVIDHSAEASQVGLQLRETTLVVFGDPPAGTPVMVAVPLAVLDFPLKVPDLARRGAGQGQPLRPRRARRALRPERRPGRHRSGHRHADRSVAPLLGAFGAWLFCGVRLRLYLG